MACPDVDDMVFPALFSDEGPEFYADAYHHNKKFARKVPYQTKLGGLEPRFRHWVHANDVPFDVVASTVDYDMRGYWKTHVHIKGLEWQGGHFPDTWKTPYDTTFSRESKYATINCPFKWCGDILIDTRSNQVIVDDR